MINYSYSISGAVGVIQVVVLHGGGSPQMEIITMTSQYDLKPLKDLPRYLAEIKPEMNRCERSPVTPRKMLRKYREYSKLRMQLKT